MHPTQGREGQAKALLDRFGGLRAILDAPIADLQQTPGIGEVAPVALRVIREAASLYLQQRAEEATVLASPESLKSFWLTRLGGLRTAAPEVAHLDSASRLMRNGVETLEEGTVDRAAVYPRRVAEAALRRSHHRPGRYPCIRTARTKPPPLKGQICVAPTLTWTSSSSPS